MKRRPTAVAAAVARRPAALGAGLIAGSAALYLSAMAPRLAAELMFGPICSGHGGLLSLHCGACYVAAALAGTGLGLVGLAAARGPRR
jgi:hypothetical protein